MPELKIASMYRGLSIFFLLTAIGLLLVGLYDYGRGAQSRLQVIPICLSANCEKVPPEARHSLLNIFRSRLSERYQNRSDSSHWLGFDAKNMCELPSLYLKKYKKDSELLEINEVFSALGLADISQSGNNWLVKPGTAVNSAGDKWKKLFNPVFAERTCYQPYYDYYWLSIPLLVCLAYSMFTLGLKKQKKI